MGVSIEQWRATIGQWSGGRQGKCGTLQNSVAETSSHIGYKQIRFLVLVSLLVIGCVELNPGPNSVRYEQIFMYVHRFCREHCTAEVKGETTNISLTNITMEIERCWKL